MALESWALDGVALTTGNFKMMELDVTPPKERADWIGAADSENGALFRVPLHENRTITMKLQVAAQASMDAVLDQIASIRDKMRKAALTESGIALVWTPHNSTRARTFDVLTGEFEEMPIGIDGQPFAWFQARPVFTIVLTCKPYWRGTESLTSTASSSTPFVTLEVASIGGDIPALGRLIVTDTATQTRRHVEWGIENQFYNSGLSLLVDSDNMTTSGYSGAGTTRTGAYDPNAAGNSVVRATLFTSPVAVCNTGALSHIGTYRVKARVFGTVDTRVRLSWRTGDGPYSTNMWATPAIIGNWSEIDLGLVQISSVTSGTQRWDGTIQAYATGTSGTIDIDYLILVPAGEGYGKAYVPARVYQPGVLSAFDDFTATTAGGGLNTRTPVLGSAWVTAGVATDFTFTDAPYGLVGAEAVTRATSGEATPRVGVLGSAMTDQETVAKVWWYNGGFTASRSGIVCRYVDINNYLAAYLTTTTGTNGALLLKVVMFKRVASVDTDLASWTATGLPATHQYLLMDMLVDSTGYATCTVTYPGGGNVTVPLTAQDSVLATAGALASGKGGIYDMNASATAFNRVYDDVSVFTPPAIQPVVYSGRVIEFGSVKTQRQDSTGVFYGPAPAYRGSRFLVPPGTSRVLVKARRNSVDYSPDDSVLDATQIQVGTTPRGLVVPR